MGKSLVCHHTQGTPAHPIIKPLIANTCPLETVKQRQHQTVNWSINHAKVMQELKSSIKKRILSSQSDATPFAKINLNLSQSEIYLKAVLANYYQEHQLENNVHYFFNHYDTSAKHLDISQKNKLIQQCIQFIKDEKKFGDDYIYFYHGCDDKVTFAYSIYTFLYETLQTSDHWPVLRAINKHFKKFKNIKQFINYYSQFGKCYIDNNATGYKECAISANVFLPGNHETDTSNSIKYYIENNTRSSIDLQSLLMELFQPFLVSNYDIKKLLQLYKHCVKNQKGSLYQLRISRNQASYYSYPAGFLGKMNKLNGEKNIDKILTILREKMNEQPADYDIVKYIKSLQARIFLPPDTSFEITHSQWHSVDYQSLLVRVMNPILSTMMLNIGQQDIDNPAIKNDLPLFRIVNDICNRRNASLQTIFLPRILLENIKKSNAKKVKGFLMRFPQFRYYPIDQIMFPLCPANSVLEYIVKRPELASILSDCYDENWWKHYTITTFSDISLILPKLVSAERYKLLESHLDKIAQADISAVISSILFSFQPLDAVDLIIKYNLNNDYAWNELLCLAIQHNHLSIIGILFDKLNIESNSQKLSAILYRAIKHNNIALAKILIQYPTLDINQLLLTDLSVNKPDTSLVGMCPLWAALYLNDHHMTSILLSHPEINVNIINHHGQTPFMIALQKRNEEIIKLFINFNGTDLWVKDNKGDSILYYVLKYSNSAIEKLLLLRAKKEGMSRTIFVNLCSTFRLMTVLEILDENECLEACEIDEVVKNGQDLGKCLRAGIKKNPFYYNDKDKQLHSAAILTYFNLAIKHASKISRFYDLLSFLELLDKSKHVEFILYHKDKIKKYEDLTEIFELLTFKQAEQLHDEFCHLVPQISFNLFLLKLQRLSRRESLSHIRIYLNNIQHGYQLAALCNLLTLSGETITGDFYKLILAKKNTIENAYRLYQIASYLPGNLRDDFINELADKILTKADLALIKPSISKETFLNINKKVSHTSYSLFAIKSPIEEAMYAFDSWMTNCVTSHIKNDLYGSNKNCLLKWLGLKGKSVNINYDDLNKMIKTLKKWGYDIPPTTEDEFKQTLEKQIDKPIHHKSYPYR